MRNNETKKNAVLSVSSLTFSYEPGSLEPVFSNISFELCPGEILTILGPNGIGKSTLFNCISRDLVPQSGEVRLNGQKIEQYSQTEAAKHIGYVPQVQNLAFDYKVRDYLVMGRCPYISALKAPGREDYEIVEQILREFKIESLGDKSTKRISGGERQQVQIARAMVQQTDIIMLDEPTNHLDYGNQLKVLNIISRLAREKKKALLLTTHTPDHAILLGGKTGILSKEGMVIGSTDDIVTEENLQRIYKAKMHLVDVECVGRKVCIAGNLE